MPTDESSCCAAARLHLSSTSLRESALAGVPTGCLCVERSHASSTVAAFRSHVLAVLGRKATHTHKLGTPRIVRGTSLLVIPVSSEAAGFLIKPTPASEQLLAALGEHVEWYPGVRAIHDSVFDDLAELRDLRKQVHWRDRLLPPSAATDESAPLQRRGFDFVELFAGVGGFRLGLEPLGGRCVFSSEINAAAKETYALNFGDGDLFGDVVEFYASDLPPFDLLTGGFPCQPFSTRGVPAWLSMRPGSPQPSRLLRATRRLLWAREESRLQLGGEPPPPGSRREAVAVLWCLPMAVDPHHRVVPSRRATRARGPTGPALQRARAATAGLPAEDVPL